MCRVGWAVMVVTFHHQLLPSEVVFNAAALLSSSNNFPRALRVPSFCVAQPCSSGVRGNDSITASRRQQRRWRRPEASGSLQLKSGAAKGSAARRKDLRQQLGGEGTRCECVVGFVLARSLFSLTTQRFRVPLDIETLLQVSLSR